MNEYYFTSSEQAVRWATDILRVAQFPALARFYRAVDQEEQETDAAEQAVRAKPCLPDRLEDQQDLAIDVYRLIGELSEELQRLVRLIYWGDYVTRKTLETALKHQEVARQRGYRVRLSHRYSQRQVAQVMGKDPRTVGKYLAQAHGEIAQRLAEVGLLLDEDYCSAGEVAKSA